jgi:hypothetical protein
VPQGQVTVRRCLAHFFCLPLALVAGLISWGDCVNMDAGGGLWEN